MHINIPDNAAANQHSSCCNSRNDGRRNDCTNKAVVAAISLSEICECTFHGNARHSGKKYRVGQKVSCCIAG